MKNLINWLLGNNKYLIDYKFHDFIQTHEIKNEVVWAKTQTEILKFIIWSNRTRKERIFSVEALELPSFSKAKDYINDDKQVIFNK